MNIVTKRPWWLDFFVGKDMWVAIHPNVYPPKGVNPNLWPEVVAHEGTHIERQKSRLRFWSYWYPRYLTSRKFRGREEIAAIRAELAMIVNPEIRNIRTLSYAGQLTTGYRPLWFSRSPFNSVQEVLELLA